MGNPWLDEARARSWQPGSREGHGWRAEQSRIVLALAALHAPRRILDLGCGVGDFDALALECFPDAAVTCLDGAPLMLERARETLAGYGARAAFVESDLARDWRAEVGDAFDVVMSLNAIHHLEREAKRDVYARCFDVLRPGGLLVLQERVAFDGRLWPHVRALWQVRPADEGTEPHALAADMDYDAWIAAERAGGDKPEMLERQLGWLRDIGFAPATCFQQLADRVVFGGIKPGG